jgi:hypothetical protein
MSTQSIAWEARSSRLVKKAALSHRTDFVQHLLIFSPQ